jgi:hypothetical protein
VECLCCINAGSKTVFFDYLDNRYKGRSKEVCYQLVKQVMYSSAVLFPNVWATIIWRCYPWKKMDIMVR